MDDKKVNDTNSLKPKREGAERMEAVRPHEPGQNAATLAPLEVAKPKSEAERPLHAKHNHAVLTDEQVDLARAKARERLGAEREKAALKAVEDEELERLRQDLGLVVGGIKDEPVMITIDVAEYSPGVKVNGRLYEHGQTYTVARHVADSLRDQMFQTWKHQNQIDGKSLTHFYQRHRNTSINARTRAQANAPGHFDA